MGRAKGCNDDMALTLDGALHRRGGRVHLAEAACEREAQALWSAYRLGELGKPADYGSSQGLFEIADKYRPQNRPGRLDGLFCAPTPEALGFWVHTVRANNGYFYEAEDLPCWELHITGPAPYVYRSSDWNRVVFRSQSEPLPRWEGDVSLLETIDRYWQSGTPLDAFLAGGHDQSDGYEVIVAPSQIVAAAPAELPLARP